MGSGRNDGLNDEAVARLIALRRELHRHPELSGQESRTAARIARDLSTLQLDVTTGVGGHGLIAELEGAHPGPTLAYRADMDALPIQEENAVDYRSQVAGVMHACGHDVHSTIGLGLAESLAQRRERLRGRIRFIFQPAEEAAAPPGQVIGAEAMARQGAVDGVDAVLAVHCMPGLPVRQFSIPEGAVWATSDIFRIHLEGRTAHAAYPHKGIDAAHMAADLVQSLLPLPSRVCDPLHPAVLTVGTIRAGTAHNVLAGQAELTGIVRTFDESTREALLTAMRRQIDRIAAAFGGRGSVEVQQGALAVVNDPILQDLVRKRLSEQVGAERVGPFPPQLAAEDFSAFSNRVPGCYIFLGVGNEQRGITHPLHSPHFDVDEACIPFAVHHLANLFEALGEDLSGRTVPRRDSGPV